MAWTGRCRCGQTTFEASAPPLITMACHCRGCQQMTASAFSLSAAIPAEAFKVTAGEPVIGGLHGAARHYFCGHCLSWMFTKPEGVDFFVNVRSTLFEPPAWTTPFVETVTSEKLDWATTPAKHSYPHFPPMEDFPAMLEEYASVREAG